MVALQTRSCCRSARDARGRLPKGPGLPLGAAERGVRTPLQAPAATGGPQVLPRFHQRGGRAGTGRSAVQRTVVEAHQKPGAAVFRPGLLPDHPEDPSPAALRDIRTSRGSSHGGAARLAAAARARHRCLPAGGRNQPGGSQRVLGQSRHLLPRRRAHSLRREPCHALDALTGADDANSRRRGSARTGWPGSWKLGASCCFKAAPGESRYEYRHGIRRSKLVQLADGQVLRRDEGYRRVSLTFRELLESRRQLCQTDADVAEVGWLSRAKKELDSHRFSYVASAEPSIGMLASGSRGVYVAQDADQLVSGPAEADLGFRYSSDRSRPTSRHNAEAAGFGRHVALCGPGALLELKPPRTSDTTKPGAWSAKASTKLPRPEEVPAFVIPRTAEDKLQVEAEAAALALLRGAGSEVGVSQQAARRDSSSRSGRATLKQLAKATATGVACDPSTVSRAQGLRC
ncbi:unnamed protein product [Symbiodinium natans]|uniref:Uncharacterized protein n=1 Tax=Symbiodinium natans TaxID=878477 RepID=A0A812V5T2_9DINO|nr:unnamed protein product [Symbiodinium natans]